jgi:glycosyltransferase involved in cell wall biosynthesis
MDMGTRGPTLLSAIVPIAGFLNGEEPFDSWFNTKIDSRVEVILVLDSSDEVLTGEINEKIAQSTNTKVTLLSSSARNPGETRNIGLAAATGSWICFWDSDDYPVIDQVLENVIEAEENYYQISVGNYLIGEHIKNHPVKFLDVQGARNLSDLYSNPGLWRMAFKRDVIKDVEFPNFRMGEDQIFLFKILATLPRIHFSSRITYKYMIYSDHQLTKSPEALRDVLLSFKKCISIYEDNPSKELAIGLYRLFITTMKIGGTRMRFSALGNLLRIWSTTPSLFLLGPHSIYRILRSQ